MSGFLSKNPLAAGVSVRPPAVAPPFPNPGCATDFQRFAHGLPLHKFSHC